MPESASPYFKTRCAITGDLIFGEAWMSSDGKYVLSKEGYEARGNYLHDRGVEYHRIGRPMPACQEFVARWQALVRQLLRYPAVTLGIRELQGAIEGVISSLDSSKLGQEKRWVPFRQIVLDGICDLHTKIATTRQGTDRIADCEALAGLVTALWSRCVLDDQEFHEKMEYWRNAPIEVADPDSESEEQSFGSKIQIHGHNVMEDWERGYMRKSVDLLVDSCRNRPMRILECGWGQGISGRCFLSRQHVEYEVVELHPQIAENARRVFANMGVDAKVHEGALEEIVAKLPPRSYDIIFFDIYSFKFGHDPVEDARDKNRWVRYYTSKLLARPDIDPFAPRLGVIERSSVDGPDLFFQAPAFVYISMLYPLLKIGGVAGHYSADEEPLGGNDLLLRNYRQTLFPDWRILRVENNVPTAASHYRAGRHMYAFAYRK